MTPLNECPCIECITYPICRNDLLSAVIRSEDKVYKFFFSYTSMASVLLRKCSILNQYSKKENLHEMDIGETLYNIFNIEKELNEVNLSFKKVGIISNYDREERHGHNF